MKSNKGIITTLCNIAEFILEQRINHSPKASSLLETIQQELQLLKDELLPSMEIFHFLVDKANYNVKHKVNNVLKSTPLQKLQLNIKIKLHDKVNNVTHIAQLWKITVKSFPEQLVPPEEVSHQLLFLLQQILNELNESPLFIHFVRNHEAQKKYILDFQIQIADIHKQSSATPKELTRTWINHARLDNSRQLVISCHSDPLIAKLINSNKKSPYNSSGTKHCGINKRSSQSTCRDSSEMIETQLPVKRDRSLSEGQIQAPLFEIYDNELDVTILSTGSQEISDSHQVCLDEQEEGEFELLIQQSNKDTEFLRDNSTLLEEWQKIIPTIL